MPDSVFSYPGGVRSASRLALLDYYFLFCLMVLPSSFLALVDQNIFYVPGRFDLKLLVAAAHVPFVPYLFRYLSGRRISWVVVALLAVSVFVLFQAVRSSYLGIPLSEIVVVVRHNLMYPILAVLLLSYLASRPMSVVYTLFRWIVMLTLVQALIYIASNFFEVQIFQAAVKDPLVHQGGIVFQNAFALPAFLLPVFLLGWISGMFGSAVFYRVLSTTCLIVVAIAIIRSMLVVFLMAMALAAALVIAKRGWASVGRVGTSWILAGVGAGLVLVAFPSHVASFADKIGLGGSDLQVRNLNTYNYEFRLRLIEDAFDNIERNDNVLLGNGYARAAYAGEYDYVLGGDTLVAPVLHTEGVAGLALRLGVVVLIVLASVRRLSSSGDGRLVVYPILALSFILPEFINIVQTEMFTHYERGVFFVLAAELVYERLRAEDLS